MVVFITFNASQSWERIVMLGYSRTPLYVQMWPISAWVWNITASDLGHKIQTLWPTKSISSDLHVHVSTITSCTHISHKQEFKHGRLYVAIRVIHYMVWTDQLYCGLLKGIWCGGKIPLFKSFDNQNLYRGWTNALSCDLMQQTCTTVKYISFKNSLVWSQLAPPHWIHQCMYTSWNISSFKHRKLTIKILPKSVLTWNNDGAQNCRLSDAMPSCGV